MRRRFGCVVLLCIGTFPIVGELDPDKRYTVIFDYIAVSAEPRFIPEDFEPDTLDLSSASVQIVRNVTNDDADIENDVMATQRLVAGKG